MTAAFDHRARGTDEQAWLVSQWADVSPLTPPGAGDELLVVAAHPDDETLGAGGLIADAHRSGAQVRVLIATNGEASHPRSPTHSAETLAVLRRGEVRSALATLAPDAAVEFLGLPDGGLGSRGAELVGAIAARADGTTHLVAPWQFDRHPDHEACGTAAAEVVARAPGCVYWQYPIWAWHWAHPDDRAWPWRDLVRHQLTREALGSKRAAMACHVSQHAPLSQAAGDEEILSAEMLAHFTRDYETFVRPCGVPG